MDSVSVIIATFNSERTLPLVLSSLRTQTYPQKHIEVLIIDGGSTDTTIRIAKKFYCKIIHNSKVEPLYAKYLGYIHAKGKYIVYVDHDEIIMDRDSVNDKVRILQQNPDIKVVIASGYRSPKGYNVINRYINEFGDPFSFFMYRLSKNPDFFLSTMRSKYRVVKETKKYTVLDLASSSEIPLIELTTAASVIDGQYFKKKFPEIKTKYHLIPHLLYLLRSSNPYIAMLKHDVLLHYASDDFRKYTQKILWRVKNNIFYTNTVGASGFTGRQEFGESGIRLKKYLFIPYALTLLFPIFDAIYLIYSRKDASYAIHVPLSVLTAVLILYFLTLRTFGIRPHLMSYDGSTTAYENN